MENLNYISFSEINLNDQFFDSLKDDYSEFESWFNKKSEDGEKAYVLYHEGGVDGFMYLKPENSEITDVEPPLEFAHHLKIGTFKFNSQGTRRGERFIKKIFDHAVEEDVDDIYVTVFSKHTYLINLFKKYGFNIAARKITDNGTENVLLRDMKSVEGDVLKDYPYVNCIENTKHLLAIHPMYHTRMLPDSILDNESHDIIKDVSHANSIHKIYICSMDGVTNFKKGDPLLLYRTTDNKGPARYRSVATSVGVFEEYKHISEFLSEADFLEYCSPYSVFSNNELTQIYRKKNYCHIIRFTYNLAMRKRITRGDLIDRVGLNQDDYWGVMELSDEQFIETANLGGIRESLIINKT